MTTCKNTDDNDRLQTKENNKNDKNMQSFVCVLMKGEKRITNIQQFLCDHSQVSLFLIPY